MHFNRKFRRRGFIRWTLMAASVAGLLPLTASLPSRAALNL
mgnify:FL=1